MTWYTRAPHAGWYVVLTLAVCVLLAAASAIYGGFARRTAAKAEAALDSIANGKWVRLDSGDVIIRRRGR